MQESKNDTPSTPSIEEIKQEAAAYKEDQNQSQTKIQLIVFKLVDGEYAIPIDQIKEVVITPRIARVPQTPDYIKGVANIRGNVIAIIDLIEKFELEEKSKNNKGKRIENSNYTLVIEDDTHKVGILVKDVPNTLTIYDTDIDNSSNVMQFSSLDSNHVKGIVNLNERLIILIDIISMMKETEINKLTTKNQ